MAEPNHTNVRKFIDASPRRTLRRTEDDTVAERNLTFNNPPATSSPIVRSVVDAGKESLILPASHLQKNELPIKINECYESEIEAPDLTKDRRKSVYRGGNLQYISDECGVRKRPTREIKCMENEAYMSKQANQDVVKPSICLSDGQEEKRVKIVENLGCVLIILSILILIYYSQFFPYAFWTIWSNFLGVKKEHECILSCPRENINYTEAKESYMRELKMLIPLHKEQGRSFWAKLLTGTEATEELSPIPHILVLTGKPEIADKVLSLADKLHRSFSKAFSCPGCDPVFGGKFKDADSGNEFFDSVENCLENHSVIIRDLDKVNGNVAMHLHSFADNENAPFKTSAIFMTVISECEYDLEKCVKDLIMEKWSNEVEEDQISSLNSRIFNLVVRVL